MPIWKTEKVFLFTLGQMWTLMLRRGRVCRGEKKGNILCGTNDDETRPPFKLILPLRIGGRAQLSKKQELFPALSVIGG